MSVGWRAVIDRGIASKYADPEEYIKWFVDRMKLDMRKAGKQPGSIRRFDDALRIIVYIEESNVTVA